MPFPLPIDPAYRKLIVTDWLDDIDDRLKINAVPDAEKSWKIANRIISVTNFTSYFNPLTRKQQRGTRKRKGKLY